MAASKLPFLMHDLRFHLAASMASLAATLIGPAAFAQGSPPVPGKAELPAEACRVAKKWDVTCIRALYARPSNQWPKPTVDAGVSWSEWRPIPPVQSAPAGWLATNAGTRELAADLQRPAIISLGQMLFFDPRLSHRGQISCASCHNPERAFTDGRPLAVGEDKMMGRRRSTPLYAAAFAPSLFWDGRAESLKAQVLKPISDPREMNHAVDDAMQRLRKLDSYYAAYAQAFGDDPGTPGEGAKPASHGASLAERKETINADKSARALAAYVASLRPETTRFDRFIEGDSAVLSDAEMVGLHLFRTQARCMNCHSGAAFTDHQFHNIGLSFYGRRNQDLGRFEATRDPKDLGAFRTPSLRNVARAGPWMHNGIFPDLKGVLRMYNAGMGQDPPKTNPPDPYAPVKSAHIKTLQLSQDDIDALLMFLEVL